MLNNDCEVRTMRHNCCDFSGIAAVRWLASATL